jgi:TetR/AcrR family tetracycline transcriptional repressor
VITTDDIVRSALALIDSDGLAAFSIRRLADKMDIGTMTVYYYFENKAEILDGVSLFVLSKIQPSHNTSVSWHENLAQLIRDLYTALNDHPSVTDLLLSQALKGPRLHHVRESLLGSLNDAGFGEQDAVESLSALISYAFGFSVARRALEQGGEPSERLERLEQLPPNEFPHLTAAKRHYASHMSDHAFERGLRHHIEGLQRDLESPVRASGASSHQRHA